MALNPYLFFDGDCREAFELYRSVFGGEFTILQTYSDAPGDLGVPEEDKDRIMHIALPVGPVTMMGSDLCSALEPVPVVGNSIAISIVAESREHCDRVFAALSEGGEVRVLMHDAFWGGYFGRWDDRFGVGWMINYEAPAP